MRIWDFFFGNGEKEVKLVEAAGATVDEDLEGWTRLSGDSHRDMSPLSQERMRKTAHYLWETNNLANRMIELPIAYMLAEGFTLTVKDPEVQGWINAFVKDPINSLDLKFAEMVREQSIFGEACWPTFVNEINGHVRLGYLDPELIETVVVDPGNAKQAIGIVTKRDKKGYKRKYKVIVTGPETIFSKRTREIRETFTDGDCFYFPINKLLTGRRGRSDLLAAADWLDAYDQFLFGEVERFQFLRAFIWDVSLAGATADEVEARAKQITPPNPGSVRVHNDSETWTASSPDIKTEDTTAASRLLRNHILGGGTIPEHWFGGGGDVNRATAGEMGEPTFKVFSMRQRYLGAMLEQMAAYVIMCRLDPTRQSPIDLTEPDPDLTPVASFPEMTARDTTKYAAALAQVTVAVASMVDREFVTLETGMNIIESVSGRLGVSFDVQKEMEAVIMERTNKAKSDNFSDEDGEI